MKRVLLLLTFFALVLAGVASASREPGPCCPAGEAGKALMAHGQGHGTHHTGGGCCQKSAEAKGNGCQDALEGEAAGGCCARARAEGSAKSGCCETDQADGAKSCCRQDGNARSGGCQRAADGEGKGCCRTPAGAEGEGGCCARAGGRS